MDDNIPSLTGFRSHARKRKNGETTIYYFYDRRSAGLPDVPLGTDYRRAVELWKDLSLKTPTFQG